MTVPMKILLVEDDQLLSTLIQKALSRQEYEITAAKNGNEAIEKARAESFDLIITDIFMPDKEGIEVIQEIKEIHPGIKIIAISSDGLAGRSSFLKIAEASGAHACLSKPFNPAQLVEKVSELAS
jgi:CheY-like chemotaxis protein